MQITGTVTVERPVIPSGDGPPGAPGADGAPGVDGADGAPGEGVAAGGTEGDFLQRGDTGTPFQTTWEQGIDSADLPSLGAPVTGDKLVTDRAGALGALLYESIANAVVALITDSAPGTLDTLNELAAALGDDPNFAATMTAELALKAPLAAAALTGALTMTHTTSQWRLFAGVGGVTALGYFLNNTDTAPVIELTSVLGLPVMRFGVGGSTPASISFALGVGGTAAAFAGGPIGVPTPTGDGHAVTKLYQDAWTVNAQTGTTYTFVIGDQGKLITFDNTSSIALTVPTNASVAFPTGTKLRLRSINTGLVSIAGAGGVTVSCPAGYAPQLRTQWSEGWLTKRGTNLWVLSGDLLPVDPYTEQTANTTVTPAMAGTVQGMNNGAGRTFTIDSAQSYTIGMKLKFVRVAGAVTIAAGTSTTFWSKIAQSTASRTISAVGGVVTATYLGTVNGTANTWLLEGDLA